MAVESPNDSPAAVPPIERRSIEAGGLQFAVATCETQSSGGRLALCLHGFPETWRSWVHQIPCLAELGYRVWVPDLRGYGETTRPRQMQDYAVEKLMGDVAALVSRVAGDTGRTCRRLRQQANGDGLAHRAVRMPRAQSARQRPCGPGEAEAVSAAGRPARPRWGLARGADC